MDTLIKVDQPAPLFQLPDRDGKKHSLRDHSHQIVVLNFWSAECPWVKRVDHELQPLLLEWGPRVSLISIASNANESNELVIKTAVERQLPIILFDSNTKVADAYGAVTTPHFFVIDAEGFLMYQGAFDDVTFQQRTPTKNYLAPAVQALFAGEKPDPCETQPYGCTIVRPTA